MNILPYPQKRGKSHRHQRVAPEVEEKLQAETEQSEPCESRRYRLDSYLNDIIPDRRELVREEYLHEQSRRKQSDPVEDIVFLRLRTLELRRKLRVLYYRT